MAERMDIFIRMNEDPDKDYCFSVRRDLQVKDLVDIFKKIPVILSPTYFYKTIPTGFKVSAHPGYFTAEGALLFEWDADYEKYLVSVDQHAQIGAALLPGTLIVPVWEFIPYRYYGLLSVLLFWLYLDLPDRISPTPGHQPTVLLANLLGQYFKGFAQEANAESAFDGVAWEILFFFLHVFKVAFIWLLFRLGVINVTTLRPWNRKGPSIQDINADTLINLGWTGVKRMTPDEWKEMHRNHIINKHGGLLKAMAAGDINIRDGIVLDEGEGWSVLRRKDFEDVKVGPNLCTLDTGKFVVSNAYLKLIGSYAQKELDDAIKEQGGQVSQEQEFDSLDKIARNIRTYGFLNGPPELKALYKTLALERVPQPPKPRIPLNEVAEKIEGPYNRNTTNTVEAPADADDEIPFDAN